jgi:hypothetical protein
MYSLSMDLSSIVKELDTLEDHRLLQECRTLKELKRSRRIIHSMKDKRAEVKEARND